YPGARRIVHDGVAFHVGAGERVAFVGPSGSGKSTLVRLLLRFYDPDGGCVRLGGRDIRELSLVELRRRIAVVSQDTYLFHGTVEDNLRMGKPDAMPAELEAAARAANADEFIARLPEGYRTVVGERGVRLSGGQRQRIAIARALLRDAPILVLDEALSSVDAESEALIQSALDRLMEGRTTLIAAHRLSSVIGADRVMVLDRGRVAESGTHAELIARRGPYWRLMSPQVESAARPDLVIAVDGRRAESDPAETDGTAPPAGLLHWLESWLAHDMAYRLLNDMRLALFRKLDALSPAYLTRRRSGDLVAVATHDVELIEYFFAHTVTPVLVAIIVPLAVLGTLAMFGWPLAVALLPFLLYAALSPLLRRAHIDQLGSRAREVSGDLSAHTVDSIQGMAEIVAFQRERARGEELTARARAYLAARMPVLADLTREHALHEAVTGLGGLARIAAAAGRHWPACHSACPAAAPSHSSAPRARARRRSRISACASGIPTRARSGWPVTTCGRGSSTISGVRSRSSLRTRTSSTTRSAPTCCWRARRHPMPSCARRSTARRSVT